MREGTWIYKESVDEWNYIDEWIFPICSECRYKADKIFKFCPECGTKMTKKEIFVRRKIVVDIDDNRI